MSAPTAQLVSTTSRTIGQLGDRMIMSSQLLHAYRTSSKALLIRWGAHLCVQGRRMNQFCDKQKLICEIHRASKALSRLCTIVYIESEILKMAGAHCFRPIETRVHPSIEITNFHTPCMLHPTYTLGIQRKGSIISRQIHFFHRLSLLVLGPVASTPVN